jgi:plastocyanin
MAAIAVAAGATFLVAATGAPAAAQTGQEHVVKGTAALKWEPADINVKPGESVTFEVAGGPPHPVASGDGSNPAGDGKFDASACSLDKMGKVGDKCTVKFDEAGTYPYFCTVHVAVGMKGVVTVGEDQGGAGTPTTTGETTTTVLDTPTAATTPPGRPGIYYAGWGLLALGGLIALGAIAGYIRFAPDFHRERK